MNTVPETPTNAYCHEGILSRSGPMVVRMMFIGELDLEKLEQHVPESTVMHAPISTPTRKLMGRTRKRSCCSTFKKVDP
jgi:hypothetical protein